MRAAIVTAPDAPPVCADLPEPTVPPGSSPCTSSEAAWTTTVTGRPPGGTTPAAG